jgi:hypothetical protein
MLQASPLFLSPTVFRWVIITAITVKEDVLKYLTFVARDINLAEGPLGVKRVLVALHRAGRSSVRDLATATRLPPPVISLLLTKLSADGMLHRDKSGAQFTEHGMRYAELDLGIASLPAGGCECCDSTGVDIGDDKYEALLEALEAIRDERPDADVTLDQVKCTVDTIARRLLLLHGWQAFDGTSILFLGDDDFVSVSSCLPAFADEFFIPDMQSGKLPFSITVADIDERILGAIRSLAKAKSISNLATFTYDAREPLPPELAGRFDVVFMDPPYTLNGAKLFLSRGMAALSGLKGGRIFLSFGHVSVDVMQSLLGLINEAGLVIEALIPSFNKYEGGNILGNVSQMVVLSTGAGIEPPIATDESFLEQIYTAVVEKETEE